MIIFLTHWMIENMKDDFANLLTINNIIIFTINNHHSSIILLTTWCWVKLALIQNDNISCILLLNIWNHSYYFSYKIIRMNWWIRIVIHMYSFWQTLGIIKDLFRFFVNSTCSFIHFIIQITWYIKVSKFLNFISRNSITLNAQYPII